MRYSYLIFPLLIAPLSVGSAQEDACSPAPQGAAVQATMPPPLSDEARAALGLRSAAEDESRNRASRAQQRARFEESAKVDAAAFQAQIALVLLDFETIEVGVTTRAEIEERFRPSAGFFGPSAETFVHPQCRYCKIDVSFAYARNMADRCRAIFAPEDAVVSVSKPYLDWPRLD